MPLENDNLRHLTAAHGYLELGMYLDAIGELDRIEPEVRHVPEVLQIKAQSYSGLGKWELMQTVSSALVRYDPANVRWIVWRAFATRRSDSLEAAGAILLEAVERQPDTAIFHFNLACYECQLGQLEVAKARLAHATKLDKAWQRAALDDEDLRPLWDSLATEF